MTDKFFYAALAGVTAGVFIRSFYNLGFAFSVFLLFLAAAIFFLFLVRRKFEAVPVKIFLLPVFLFSLSVGFLRFDLSDFRAGDLALNRVLSEKASLIGVVSEEPDERDTGARLTVSLEKIIENNKEIPVASKVLVTVPLPNTLRYGDRVFLTGVIETPRSYEPEPGRPPFDYAAYLAKDGIYYVMRNPKTDILASGQGNTIKGALFSLKERFMANIGKLIPEPEASLLGGLVVGARRSLSPATLTEFQRAGVIHIVVLSGYNITIVAEAITKLFSFLPRFFGFSFGALGIVLFAIMTGGSATVVRASLMSLLLVVASASRRKYHMTRALLIAGFLMVLQNPRILVFDSSFQLSFLATVALVYVSPLVERHLSFVTPRLGIRQIVTATVATQIFVLPLLLYKTGLLSLVALPVNLLILPAIPVTMLFGFLAGALGFVWSLAAAPFAYAAYFLLAYELKVVAFFSALPYAAILFPAPSGSAVIVIYGTIAIVLVWWHGEIGRDKEKKTG